MSGASRREFLHKMLAAPALAGGWWRWVPQGPERCLIVVELNGGNDGLNTIVPAEDARYRKARPTLAVAPRRDLELGSGLYLHPSLQQLVRWFGEGRATAILDVGYPEPDRSHFRSMDIWHSASTAPGEPHHGWLGRAADRLASADCPLPALALGGLETPLLLRAERVQVPSLQSLEDYQVAVDPGLDQADAERRRAQLAELQTGRGASELGEFLRATARSAYAGAADLRQQLAAYRPAVEFPGTAIGKSLALCAKVVASGFGSRILYVRQSGYDTHASQEPTHRALLGDLGAAIGALLSDLEKQGKLDQCLVLCFSEFGRRVVENQSRGTDHGAAGPMLALGGGLRQKLLGKPPDLGDLELGDVRHQVDFRSVYAAVLRGWIGIEPTSVLGGEFPEVPLLRA